jgi:hypothetical protein
VIPVFSDSSQVTTAEERYVHFVECIQSLNTARRILTELGSVSPGVVRGAAYRMALVEYAKPYKASYGNHSRGARPYVLTTPQLSATDLAFHERILNLRDKVLAHSDLTLKDAVVYASRVQDQPLVSVASNYPPSFPDVESVVRLIEHTLDAMYVELDQLEDMLSRQGVSDTAARHSSQ